MQSPGRKGHGDSSYPIEPDCLAKIPPNHICPYRNINTYISAGSKDPKCSLRDPPLRRLSLSHRIQPDHWAAGTHGGIVRGLKLVRFFFFLNKKKYISVFDFGAALRIPQIFSTQPLLPVFASSCKPLIRLTSWTPSPEDDSGFGIKVLDLLHAVMVLWNIWISAMRWVQFSGEISSKLVVTMCILTAAVIAARWLVVWNRDAGFNNVILNSFYHYYYSRYF